MGVLLQAAPVKPFSDLGGSIVGMLGGGVALILVGLFAFVGGFLLGQYMAQYR